MNDRPAGVNCPHCAFPVPLLRIRRNPLMRLLDRSSRHYACPDCGRRYLRLRRRLLRLSPARA